MIKEIEMYKENAGTSGQTRYCVWLAGENESGMKFTARTIEDVAEQLKNHLIDNCEELFTHV